MDSPHVDDVLPIEIEVQAVQQLRAQQADFLLLDCRERDEHALVKIEGSVLIPMSEISRRVDELVPHRDRHIVVYCHHGGRSLQVTRWLQRQDFSRVQNMAGGIDAWSVRVDPSLPRY